MLPEHGRTARDLLVAQGRIVREGAEQLWPRIFRGPSSSARAIFRTAGTAFPSRTMGCRPVCRADGTYNASPEMFMQRLTNILPQVFGLKQLFLHPPFVRHGSKKEVTKELHLSNTTNPLTGNFEEIIYRARCRNASGATTPAKRTATPTRPYG